MSVEFTAFRKPSTHERRLLEALAACWSSSPQDWVQRVVVRPMKDGGMGSLELRLPESGASRTLGRRVAELHFKDDDGVDVIASLNVDERNVPFELDLWKTDFSPLIRVPDVLDSG